MDERPFSDISYEWFLNEERLMGSRCTTCGALFVPPRPICIRCHGTDMVWVEMEGGSGTIDSDSEFDIEYTTTTSTINGHAANGGAGGMFAGPKANGAGGGWTMMRGDSGNEEFATGEFHAERGAFSHNVNSQ